MKLKLSLFLVLLIFVCSCEKDNNEQILLEQRKKAALKEIFLTYHASRFKKTSYEEIVKETHTISQKYEVDLNPISKEEFEEHFAFFENARVQDQPCAAWTIYSSEWVDEGNGCFGHVWHHSDGSTAYQQVCSWYTGDIHVGKFECYPL